jgi:hypothetical protein
MWRMDYPLYDASVPVFRRYLHQLQGLLNQAEQHAGQQGLSTLTLLQARLAPGMLPLALQVEVAVNFVFRACAPLTGLAVPPLGEHSASFPALQARIAEGLAFLGTLQPDDFVGAAQRQITDAAGETFVILDGSAFLLQYALPNFFFHTSMAYAILRHAGVPLGKADFDGWHVYTPASPPA